MEIPFTKASRSRLGIEWELACVEHESGELAPAAPELLELVGVSEGFPQVTRELLTNTVELVSAPSNTVGVAVEELRGLLSRVMAVANERGIDLMCAGTHPFSQALEQQVTPGSPRYDQLIDRTRWWGELMSIWGVHVHVSVDDREKVWPIIAGLMTYQPHLQALSASSPFWHSHATSYASNRAMLFQQLPTAGLPPDFTRWEQYEQIVADLTHVGVIDDLSELRWDVRPAPKWGTIEVRAFDGLATLAEVGSLAALSQCLVEHFSRELDAGREIEWLQPWYARENKWRAARYGMDAIVIGNRAGDERLITEDLAELIVTLEPVAADLGCSAELAGLADIVAGGASYQRQLRVAEANSWQLRAVVRSLVDELAGSAG
ncbi:MAG: glutamate--cysteine ligase [Candidatus Nanopelagicales bacterium]